MNNIRSYFDAEKNESLLFIAAGLLALGCSVYFIGWMKKPFYYGMSAPLLLVACIQIVVGTTVYVRSPKDIERVNSYITNDLSAIKKIEIPRMQSVMKSFVWYRWIEIALIITGIVCFVFLKKRNG
ncbi:MAG: hypothetical protein IPO27_04535 [Bacteroidetes bacterium]|nr:hypothetical protein [Bacteroidota bacterium]